MEDSVSKGGRFVVDGVAFESAPTNPRLTASPRLFLGRDGVTGFEGGVAARGESVDRVYRDGNFPRRVSRASRTCSLAGVALAPVQAGLESLNDAIVGIGLSQWPRMPFRVEWTKYGRTKWGMATLAGTPDFKDRMLDTRMGVADFFVQMSFEDPNWYGDAREATVAANTPARVRHEGNTVAFPKLTIRGSSEGGYSVTSGNRRYTVTAGLWSHSPHVIDMASGLLTIGGVRIPGAITRADTWGIVPGGLTEFKVSAGTMTISYFDTWG